MTAAGTSTRVADGFRLAMRNVAAAVAIVTVFDTRYPLGTTVSAFTPLSMDPPLLLISLDNTSRLLASVAPGQAVGVNVLGSEQRDLARKFAQRDVDRWKGVDWYSDAGAPALMDRHAFVGITVDQLIPAGDHTLLIGAVTTSAWADGAPLTYWQRSFGTHHEG